MKERPPNVGIKAAQRNVLSLVTFLALKKPQLCSSFSR
jgi:hypothetical protein